MTPIDIIDQFYKKGSPLYQTLVDHSCRVTEKSLEIAGSLSHLAPDLDFIEQAAMLHDIGIFKTRAPAIGCTGELPYICHGFLGRQLLDDLGLDPGVGLVAERHTGAGITKDNILRADLPLPKRDMVPITLEEKIICCADKYFSKTPKNNPMTREGITRELGDLSSGHGQRFAQWAEEFNLK